MIWHICKKDLRLLWPWVLLLAVLQAGVRVFEFAKYPLSGAVLYGTEQIFAYGPLVVIAAVVALVVQQDGIPGITLDWLVRPIRRSRLFLAKFSFCALTILLPMAVLDVVECLAMGFGVLPALSASLSHGLFVLLAAILPFLAIAAITEGIADFAATLLLMYLLIAGFELLGRDYLGLHAAPNTIIGDNWSQFYWILTTAKYGIILMGSLVALRLQYAGRLTRRSRVLLPVFVLAGFAVLYVPWRDIMPLQERLSRDLDASRSIAIEFDPTLSPQHLVRGIFSGDETMLSIPIKVTGVPGQTQLYVDVAEIRFLDSEGRLVHDFAPATASVGPVAPDSVFRLMPDPELPSYITYLVREGDETAKLLQGRTSKVLVDFGLTLVEKDGEDVRFGPSATPFPLPKLGFCETKVEEANYYGMPPIELGCHQVGPEADGSLLSADIGDTSHPSGQSYLFRGFAPFFAQLLPDAVNRYGFAVNLDTEKSTRVVYPTVRFTLRNFRSLAHFRYRLEIPAIRLEDWRDPIEP